MSVALKSMYQLVDGILDEGLPYVAEYVEKLLNRPLAILDNTGVIHYPDSSENQIPSDSTLMHLLQSGSQLDYFYCEAESSLYYLINYSGSFAYVIVKMLPKNLVPKALSILAEARLAIKCYFSNLSKTTLSQANFETELEAYLFSKSGGDLGDIFKLCTRDFDLGAPFYMALIQPDETNLNINWQGIGSYFKYYLTKIDSKAIPIAGSDYLIAAIPARFVNGKLENPLSSVSCIKEALEKQFSMSFSVGLGQIYPLSNLKRSFHEARIALTLTKLLGIQKFSQQFSDLGIFSHIFAQDQDLLNSYCLQTIGRIIEHDKTNNGELMATLRLLMDNNGNTKLTAERLFIHINTLYYRMNKIEELLEMNISQMDNRVNLYTAIKVWDTLHESGLAE
ncbi:MAG: PucR family transcriptional regulator [Ignavibacteriales bacterium]